MTASAPAPATPGTVRKTLTGIIGCVTAEAAFLVLLAVGVAGAWLYIEFRQVAADRDDLARRVELICAGAGKDFAARCLIPRFDGAILSLEWKEVVWARFVMGAPRPRTPSEQQYSDRKLRSRR